MTSGATGARRSAALHVIAAILHETCRVLAVQRKDETVWRPPGGDVADGEPVITAARRHVRRATGFEIAAYDASDRCSFGSHSLVVVRCRVSGVGSDIAPDIRALRWLRRSDVLSQPHAPWTRGLLRALDSTWDLSNKPQPDRLLAV